MSDSLRIAFIGLRGVPASYGGVERHVEELGQRLAARGHDVTVFCRTNYVPAPYDDYLGMHRRGVSTVSSKHLDAIVHSLASSVRALRGFDIVHYHALGPGLPAPIVRGASRAKVVITVHGLDGQRAKWGMAARSILRTAEWMSARVPHATVVVSQDLALHYRQRYARDTEVIRNGVDAQPLAAAGDTLQALGLEPGRYVLFVGRLVPEKAPDVLVRAFAGMAADIPLVLVGGSSFTDDYVASLQRLVGDRRDIVMPGFRYGESLRELYSNAAVFVLPSLLEGLPLTLLEAASYGVPVIASAIPPHVEILGSDQPGRRLVPPGDVTALRAALEKVLANLDAERLWAASLRADVLSGFSWNAATDAHERLYARLLGRPAPQVPARVVDLRTGARDAVDELSGRTVAAAAASAGAAAPPELEHVPVP